MLLQFKEVSVSWIVKHFTLQFSNFYIGRGLCLTPLFLSKTDNPTRSIQIQTVNMIMTKEVRD